MKKTGKLLPIILGAATACFIVVILALLFMDNIMRAAAPSLYLSGRAANTYNELKQETEEMSKRPGFLSLITDHHMLTFDGTVNGISADITEQFDKSIPQSYITGKILNINTELIINNDTTSICLPDLSEYRFCVPSNELGSAINSSPLSSALPFKIGSGAAVYLPNAKQVNTDSIYSAFTELLNTAKIDRRSEKLEQYTLYNVNISGDTLKQTISSLLSSFLGNDSTIGSSIITAVNESEFPSTAMIQLGERDKRFVYLNIDENINGEPFKLTIDLSGAVNLLDNISFSASYDIAGETFGISVKSEGSHTRINEDYSDDTEISVKTPFTQNIFAEIDIRPSDENDFSCRIKLQSDFGGAILESKGSRDGNRLIYDIENLNIFDKYKASGNMTIEPQNDDIMIEEREVKDLSDVHSLAEIR